MSNFNFKTPYSPNHSFSLSKSLRIKANISRLLAITAIPYITDTTNIFTNIGIDSDDSLYYNTSIIYSFTKSFSLNYTSDWDTECTIIHGQLDDTGKATYIIPKEDLGKTITCIAIFVNNDNTGSSAAYITDKISIMQTKDIGYVELERLGFSQQ